MRHYCTLFDSAYLVKGLAMYTSLAKHSSEPFMLHILPMDDECRWTLEALELPHVDLINLRELEEALFLKRDRERRTKTEYCWMMASVLTDYILSCGQVLDVTHMDSAQPEFITAGPFGPLSEITYLDADLFFFADPSSVFKEIGERSIAITPHRLIPSKKYLEVNGLFNVGWVTFRNTDAGRNCLRQWASDCRDWCFNRVEPDRFGDQKYLDVWPSRYGEWLCQLGITVNVAPWNVGNWKVTEGPCVDGQPIICYHMHEFYDQGGEGTYLLTNYDLRYEDKQFIYMPYIQAYEQAKDLQARAHLKMESERA